MGEYTSLLMGTSFLLVVSLITILHMNHKQKVRKANEQRKVG